MGCNIRKRGLKCISCSNIHEWKKVYYSAPDIFFSVWLSSLGGAFVPPPSQNTVFALTVLPLRYVVTVYFVNTVTHLNAYLSNVNIHSKVGVCHVVAHFNVKFYF